MLRGRNPEENLLASFRHRKVGGRRGFGTSVKLTNVSIRGYSLQRGKPVMLRPSIQKPRVFGSDNPKLAYGFLNLILLFENIPSHFYDWISDGAFQSPGDKSMVKEISNSLTAFVPFVSEFFETQEVDIYVTRDWLQTMLWKHSTRNSIDYMQEAKLCTLAYSPISTGKSILKLIALASQSSMDAHGIGMVSATHSLLVVFSRIYFYFAFPNDCGRSKSCTTSVAPW